MVKDIYKDSPFLTKEKTEAILSNFLSSDPLSISNILKNSEEEIEKLEDEELIVTFQVLKEEIEREKPRIPVILGMLSNFNGYPALDSYRLIISEFYSNSKS